MKKTKFMGMATAAIMAIAISACSQSANAQLPVDVTLGYANNNALDKDGLRAEVGTEVRGLRLGVTSLTSDDKLESYGVYSALPMRVSGTKLSIVPRVEVERFKEIKEDVVSVGVGAEYQITPTLRADALMKYTRDVMSDTDIRGESFLVGVTKRF